MRTRSRAGWIRLDGGPLGVDTAETDGADGNLLTATFMDYLCPTAPDLPPLRFAHRESPSPFTALGAKGLGEGTTMSAPAAIANAVADALGHDRVELPLTPPRVWERAVASGADLP